MSCFHRSGTSGCCKIIHAVIRKSGRKLSNPSMVLESRHSFIHNMYWVTWQIKRALSEFRFYIYTVKTYVCDIFPGNGIHIHCFPRTQKYMLMSLWACSVVSRVVQCPHASSPFFTISLITEAFDSLPSTFPQFGRFPL